MADEIRAILQILRGNQAVQETQFSSSFLNNVAAAIASQRDLEAANVFLGNRVLSDDPQIQRQAKVLNQEVLPVLRTLPRRERRIHIVVGIIKMLPALQDKEFTL